MNKHLIGEDIWDNDDIEIKFGVSTLCMVNSGLTIYHSSDFRDYMIYPLAIKGYYIVRKNMKIVKPEDDIV